MSDQSIAAPTEFRKPTHPRFVDLTGKTFGHLFVISFQGINAKHQSLWLCSCICGTDHVVTGADLGRPRTRTRKCYRNKRISERSEKHGDSGKRLYALHCNILRRCLSPGCVSFGDYGGRGITVCDEWRTSYVAFRDWALSHGYRDDLTIERIDVNGNYEPGNCTWIPNSEQGLNRTDNKILTAFGESKPLVLWADDPRCRVKYGTLHSRLVDGWEFEKALTTPRVRPPRGGTAGKDPDVGI